VDLGTPGGRSSKEYAKQRRIVWRHCRGRKGRGACDAQLAFASLGLEAEKRLLGQGAKHVRLQSRTPCAESYVEESPYARLDNRRRSSRKGRSADEAYLWMQYQQEGEKSGRVILNVSERTAGGRVLGRLQEFSPCMYLSPIRRRQPRNVSVGLLLGAWAFDRRYKAWRGVDRNKARQAAETSFI
jgi:hypothetical protein